ncbi:hypothetical protein STPYR_12799 [uncultured Stenotrophomonas sp.]|uniref:Uncharacterized protein n=1 Tax=uncultured Stenotrophomonas sp. TaxID=165438 RepID=A0A1Y5Q936_9GAMM|nr:hypothetical protein STPYR_12799 [uncultured Stenotrophomonas sp.]
MARRHPVGGRAVGRRRGDVRSRLRRHPAQALQPHSNYGRAERAVGIEADRAQRVVAVRRFRECVMFNVGTISANNRVRLVKLTNRYIPSSQAYFQTNGVLQVFNVGDIPGEWYAPGPTANIGLGYEGRYALQAGSAPGGGGGAITTNWQVISGTYGLILYWNSGFSGRVLVEIRNKATQAVQASAQIWNSPAYAP